MVSRRVEGVGGEGEGGGELMGMMLIGVGLVEGLGMMGVVIGLMRFGG
ncbi:hypothetical protein [Staphylococcus epidermidis]